MVVTFALLIFALGYLAITLEHKIHINKSAVALFVGTSLWLMLLFDQSIHIEEAIGESAIEIFEIVIFLLAAMSLVEVLVHYKFFDIVRGKIHAIGLGERKQYLLVAVIAFFLSAIIDNLTTTIVMTQISRRFFQKDNLLIAVATIVISANAGGAFSPIGDVTTIMLWLAGKFGTGEIMLQGFLPSVALLVTVLFLLYPKVKEIPFEIESEIVTKLSRSEKIVVVLTFASFSLPLIMGLVSVPPYVGLLIGLSVVWIVVDLFKKFRPRQTHLEASIEEFIQKTDIASLMFFVGILMAVSALSHLGLLDSLSHMIYGTSPSDIQVIFGNIGMGAISAILDNVPLTAIAIEVLHVSNSSLWVLLALAVGTGGSLLIVGSAAGVVAMGMVKELNFGNYLRIAALPALVGYLAAMLVWYVQFLIF
ncbi:sodium:proton antiporter NhaD [candidate division WWE3 bacterium]|uniref:Sodium:proton antiporter NhaD n=1 Tax=candidate division WWE3 bacterium TaxID=2053526 RepID=A0A955RWM1_UNCKA|nr:sodium:proton antiporter NhaD [candidate division WWE3 bacterium]